MFCQPDLEGQFDSESERYDDGQPRLLQLILHQSDHGERSCLPSRSYPTSETWTLLELPPPNQNSTSLVISSSWSPHISPQVCSHRQPPASESPSPSRFPLPTQATNREVHFPFPLPVYASLSNFGKMVAMVLRSYSPGVLSSLCGVRSRH